MNKREVIRMVMQGKRAPYVPWHFMFTQPAQARLLLKHFGSHDAMEDGLDNHYVVLGHDLGFHEDLGCGRTRDNFGVVWDRTVDKDIGTPEGLVLSEPMLKNYELPDPLDQRYFKDIEERIDAFPDRFRVYYVGFTLFERAWTLRGMENLLMDFHINPGFVRELLTTLMDWQIAHVREALKYDIDCVRFGDDWGCQRGLIMGPECWKEFIYPQVKRFCSVIRGADKFVLLHCCGDVDRLFDDLIHIGVNCFNPFQPDVMDVWSLLPKYRDRLSFYGGLSVQGVLPRGTPGEVRQATRRLLEAGADGGYIFGPSHDVTADTPLENMLACVQEVQNQDGYKTMSAKAVNAHRG